MENSLQNIILQEMEDLKGILIATTNLTENLDKAFERRFLYKVKFNNPSVEIKCQIWNAMMPELPEADAHYLAEKFDFSGGQIENVVRKKTIQNILTGHEPAMEALLTFCCEEMIGTRNQQRKILRRALRPPVPAEPLLANTAIMCLRPHQNANREPRLCLM